MRKGTAMEGFIRNDGTIRPIEHYDDTELRGKIQINTDNISNLDSRVTELEEHGGAEDPTKADKVVDATSGNLASLDADGNLQDSGKKPADFADKIHYHSHISGDVEFGKGQVYIDEDSSGYPMVTFLLKEITDPSAPVIEEASISFDNINNLKRALKDPAAPISVGDQLITNGQVFEALETKEDEYPILTLSLQKTQYGKYTLIEADAQSLSSFVSAFPNNKTIPCLVNINEFIIPASVSRHDQRLGSNGPIRHFVLLSFCNRLFMTNPAITTDKYWAELNEDMIVIPEFAIRVVDYTDFSLKDDHFSENALIDMRNNVESGQMIRCRVMMDVVHNEGHGYLSDVSNAKLDGYIMWKDDSDQGKYVYTILLGSSLFTLTSDDNNLGSTAFVRNANFRL